MPEVLALRPGALGDTLLAVPALRALRRRFPRHTLRLAAHRGAARLLEHVGEVDLGLAFDDASLAWAFGAGPSPPRAPAVVVAWMSDSGDVAGHLAANGVDRVLIAPSRPDEGAGAHCARHLLDSLAPLGVPDEMDDRPLAVAASPDDAVLVHPGSGAARKNWPPERFAAVCRLLQEHGIPVKLISGEADERPVEAIQAFLRGHADVLRLADLGDLASRLAGCRAYLGNDSGVSHLAGLVGARTVAMFGPTSPTVWAPLGPRVQVRGFEAEPEQVWRDLLGWRVSGGPAVR